MDQHGINRVRSDGLEEAEARLTMFKMPHRLPVGEERMRMHPNEYNRRAKPALMDAKAHEQDVMDAIETKARNPHGGERMAAVAFNQQPRSHVQRNMINNQAHQYLGWGELPAQMQGHAGRDTESQIRFSDDIATTLVDGRGHEDGRGYVKGAQLADGVGVHQHRRVDQAGRRQQQPPPRLIPTSAMLGADVRGTWTVDRDQQNLEMATNPAALARAAEMAEGNARVCDHNRKQSRRSAIKFGDYELNPGGHRLNDAQDRADDYGIARLRQDNGVPVMAYSRQVADLMRDPDPRLRGLEPQPHNKFAGKSQQSNLSFGTDGAVDSVHRGPYAGRRAKSVVFEDGAGPAQQQAGSGEGNYLGLDAKGGLMPKHNAYAGRITDSGPMAHHIKYDPAGHADEVRMAHERRRSHMHSPARRIPVVEDVVFNHHPLNRNAEGQAEGQGYSHAEPVRYTQAVEGKRSVHSGLMPNVRAAHTSVGPRELGGSATVTHPDEVASQDKGPKGGYPDHKDLLQYDEFTRDRLPPPPPPLPYSVVGEAINGGQVAPNAYSAEPSGLPKRHPGPERLKRGRGVDGLGHDHQGRQLATSLVDEVIFGRQNFQGKIPQANICANFTIDQAGEFGHR